MVCYDVEIEPSLQVLTGEELNRGANTAPDARLDVHCRGFWEKQRAAFFDIRVCHPNADSYKDLNPKQIYRLHENEKKRKYASRVIEVEQGTFTPPVFNTTGGMADECLRYHARLAELISAKKHEDYATTISWIRAKVSFAILRSTLLCLIQGLRSRKWTGWTELILFCFVFIIYFFSVRLFFYIIITMTIVFITMSCRHFLLVNTFLLILHVQRTSKILVFLVF